MNKTDDTNVPTPVLPDISDLIYFLNLHYVGLGNGDPSGRNMLLRAKILQSVLNSIRTQRNILLGHKLIILLCYLTLLRETFRVGPSFGANSKMIQTRKDLFVVVKGIYASQSRRIKFICCMKTKENTTSTLKNQMLN